MSRPIKFRGWTGQCYWHNVIPANGGKAFVDIRLEENDNGGEYEYVDRYDWNGVVVEQFTGLLDRNGKEIYEGDIVRYRSGILLGYATCVVAFYNCRWVLSQHNVPVWAISEGDSENIEIIGNIHENGDLLE